MTFRGWSHSLAEYAQAFEQAGLLIEALREPLMPSEPPPPDPASARWSRIPMFLMLRLTQAPA
jgi:hypothetical protein